ncbi:MAG: metallophosphoesterase [Opitutaceae bacterium]
MPILFVADIHYALKQFDWLVSQVDSYEAIIIGGDLLDLSSALDFDIQIVVVEKYLHQLRQKTRLCVCSGNHDGDARNSADESVAQWLVQAKAEGLHVDFDHLRINGTLITICPWWDGPHGRAELEALLEAGSREAREKWIWIHHAPPDASPVSWTGKRFVGDAFLVDSIRRYQPDLVLSGHVHNAPFYPDGSWIDRIGKAWVMNPGRQIGAVPAFISLDLDAMTAEWISIQDRGAQDLTSPLAAVD